MLGLGLTLGYYGLVQLGEGLIQSGRVGVMSGVWLPNAILMLLGLVFLAMALRGMPSYWAVLGSCTIIIPTWALIAFMPIVPSVPVPERMMPIARSNWSSASD